MFNVSPVYLENYNATENIVINQGGTDSGKTYALMQLMFTRAMTFDAPLIDPIITIVGESVPNLKKGAYRHAKAIYISNPELNQYIKSWNETDRIITFVTGWQMEFISCDTEQSAKQGKRQYLFVNEANGIPYLVFWQLAKRTRRQTFIDYNPTIRFWAHEKLIGTTKQSNDLAASVRLIISDHRHNPFLTEEDHYRTENIKDPELWRVYARGLTGNLDGIIFSNWNVIPDKDFPDEDFVCGLDFGYTNDPTAGVKVCKVGNNLFVKELCYTAGLAPLQIKQILDANKAGSDVPIYCDHDPDNISALQRLGIYAVAARKGQGSINAGIMFLKQFNVFITESSTNLIEEKTKYSWAKDKSTGDKLNKPIDAYCHCIDALRYAVYTNWSVTDL
jgi:phage terminase large subunit